jgi:hypothetical protein
VPNNYDCLPDCGKAVTGSLRFVHPRRFREIFGCQSRMEVTCSPVVIARNRRHSRLTSFAAEKLFAGMTKSEALRFLRFS